MLVHTLARLSGGKVRKVMGKANQMDQHQGQLMPKVIRWSGPSLALTRFLKNSVILSSVIRTHSRATAPVSRTMSSTASITKQAYRTSRQQSAHLVGNHKDCGFTRRILRFSPAMR